MAFTWCTSKNQVWDCIYFKNILWLLSANWCFQKKTTNSKKIPQANLTKRKISQNLILCIRSGLISRAKIISALHLVAIFESKKPILNRIKIWVKDSGRTGFPRPGRAAPRDFPWGLPSKNFSEQPCQPSENPVHPTSFTPINPAWGNL